MVEDYYLKKLDSYEDIGGIWLDLNEPANFKDIN